MLKAARIPDFRGLMIPAAILLIWEILARIGVLAPMSFSRPTEVFLAGLGMLLDGTLIHATLQTLQSVLVGFGLALAAGIVLSLLIGTSQTLRQMLAPTLAALRSIPPIALVPLALLIFGFGIRMESSIITFACIWPILIAGVAGIMGLDTKTKDVASALEMTHWQYLRLIVLPSTVGRIIVGARIAMGIALIVGITVEIIINPRGLGYGIITAQQSLRPDSMYAQILWIGCMGWGLNFLMTFAERSLLSRFTR